MILGFLGSGNMASAMARGWARNAEPPPMLFTDSGSGRAARLAAETGGEAVSSNRELAARCDLLILGCKPKDLGTAAASAPEAGAVLSLLGATPVASVAAAFPNSQAFRVMPNLGVEINRGVLCFSAHGSPPEAGAVVALLEQLGRVVELDDTQIDAATSVMGCTPAYLDQFVTAIAAAGHREGLDAKLAREMVLATFAGTCELLAAREPGELARAVASPGGSTEAGLEALAAARFEAATAGAVEASMARMRGER